jgi:outer membrane protein TolC
MLNFNIKSISLILLLGWVSISTSLEAQEQSPISLEEVKAQARSNNTDLKLFQKKYEVARANYEQTRAVLLPQVRLTNTSTFTNNPLMAFGFKLLQRDVSAPDFDPSVLNDPGDVENFNTRIEVQQPIINVDGWEQRKAANLQLEISGLQEERYLEYLDLEVTKTYMQLQLAYKSVAVLEKARETALENEKTARDNLDQGLIQNADFLNVQVRKGEVENQLLAAKGQVENVSEYLNVLIGKGTDSYLIPETDLLPQESKESEQLVLNNERKDIRANAIAAEAQKKMYSSSKLNFVPRANAMASYEWNDPEIFGFGANNYMIGIQLSWDLFGGYKNIGKIHKEKALLEQAQLEQQKYLDQSEMELNKALRQRTESQNRMVLAGLAMEQSGEALRVITNRFEQGLEKTMDLLHAESQFLEKELAYYESVFNLNYSQAFLEFLSK